MWKCRHDDNDNDLGGAAAAAAMSREKFENALWERGRPTDCAARATARQTGNFLHHHITRKDIFIHMDQ